MCIINLVAGLYHYNVIGGMSCRFCHVHMTNLIYSLHLSFIHDIFVYLSKNITYGLQR